MSRTRIGTAGLIIGLVIMIGFVFSVPHTSEIKEQNAAAIHSEPVIPAVTIHDAYKKGIHTLSGTIAVPNPCTFVSATASVVGDASSTQSIAVQISVPESTGICLQIVQNGEFSTTVQAPVSLPIKTYVNGSLASTTVQ